jgi:hypothetical protein
MLTYADACLRMLTYADVCRAAEGTVTYEEMRELLDVPWSLLEDLQAKGLAAGAHFTCFTSTKVHILTQTADATTYGTLLRVCTYADVC